MSAGAARTSAVAAAVRAAHALLQSIVLALAIVFAAVLGARAAEEISSYHIGIEVLPNASVEVTETIVAVSEGAAIKHGLFRILFDDNMVPGTTRRVPVTVVSVERDGAPEPYLVEDVGRGLKVYLGSADVLLEPGRHTWVFRYRVAQVAQMLPDGNPFAWLAFSGDWGFPVFGVKASVTVPAGAVLTGTSGRITRTGTEEAGTWMAVSDQEARFAPAPLAEIEDGLWLMVTFDGGLVTRGKLDQVP